MKISICLNNVIIWRGDRLQRAGDLNVAAQLARKLNSPVYVAATEDEIIQQLFDLYPDVEFRKYEEYQDELSNTVILSVLLELRDEKHSQQTLDYVKSLLSHKLVYVCNLSDYADFYEQRLHECENLALRNAAEELIFHSAKLVTHLKTSYSNGRSFGRILWYDHTDEWAARHSLLTPIEYLTFCRNSSIKGVQSWFAYAESHAKDDGLHRQRVLLCEGDFEHSQNIKEYPSMMQYFNDPMRVCFDYVHINERFQHDDSFTRLLLSSSNYLIFTNYQKVEDHYDEPHLIVEYAHLEALKAGLTLRYSELAMRSTKFVETLDTMSRLNQMNLSEQRKYFAEYLSLDQWLANLQKDMEAHNG